MPYWGMSDLGELSDLGVFGDLGAARYGALVGGSVANALQQYQAGAWLAVNPTLAPACALDANGIPGCVFDPAHPEMLYLTRFDPQAGMAPSGYAPTGTGGFAFTGAAGSAPWPGASAPGGGPVPTAQQSTLNQITQIFTQAQPISEAATTLEYNVTTAIQNAGAVSGADTSAAQSTLSALQNTVSQINSLLEQIPTETTIPSAQSVLIQMQQLALVAKSQAAQAITQANQAGQIAQNALMQQQQASAQSQYQSQMQPYFAAQQYAQQQYVQQQQISPYQQAGYASSGLLPGGAMPGYYGGAPYAGLPYQQDSFAYPPSPYGYGGQSDVFLTQPPELAPEGNF